MTLVIDGVHLQLKQREPMRLWQAMLPLLVTRVGMPLVLLDRGGEGARLEGAEVVPFPGWKPKFSSEDSALLERVCRHYGAQAFLSTHITTPLSTPSVLLVTGPVNSMPAPEGHSREQQELEAAIAHARRHVCLWQSTRDQLLTAFPELAQAGQPRIPCLPPGVGDNLFRPAGHSAISAWRRAHRVARPYLVAFEPAESQTAQGSSGILPQALEALALQGGGAFDLLLVDARAIEPQGSDLAHGGRLVRAAQTDEALGVALSGAQALLRTCARGDLGLSVAEAMACGCPVMLGSDDPLAVELRDAVVTWQPAEAGSLAAALRLLGDRALRQGLVEAGLRHERTFRLEPLADALASAVQAIVREHQADMHHAFHQQWTRLRALQGEVDIIP